MHFFLVLTDMKDVIHICHIQVSAHEIKCKSGSYGCPLCPPDKFEPASAYYFFNHYKISHPDNILSTPEFLIDINEESENKFVYCKNNHIYIVYARVYVDDKSLTVNASNIVHKEQCTKVAQKVILRTLNKKLLIETKYQACSSLDNNLNAFRIPLSN
ncbi:hypothetical protein NQ318_001635 [Aromia moschata]|uniref:Uncharacterized protein n=1 Tax=Aromia moschata TaxID=1265417 RepID=A0AAV8Y3T8_9CUCU|nr:hypothetical protein NQ318_001635 [Aromia moschata]